MTDTPIDTQSPLTPFANAFAGLLQQLAAVPQVAELEAYKQNVVGKEIADLSKAQLTEVMQPANEQVYAQAILAANPDETLQAAGQVTPEMWDATAQKVQELNTALTELDEAGKMAWLQAQGVDATAENLQEALAPKVTEWLTNPGEALTAAHQIIETQKAEKKAHKHELQDSVAKFVSTLLTAAKGEDSKICRETAKQLIYEHAEQFGKHSPEHYLHVLMQSVDNFNLYSAEEQREILTAAMQGFIEKHKAQMAPEQLAEAEAQIKEGPKVLEAKDVMVMLDSLMMIPPPNYIKMLQTAKGERAVPEVEVQPQAATGFTGRILAEKTEAKSAVPSVA